MMNVYMEEALALAKSAADEGEVPVGAVIVRHGEIIARGRNRREIGRNALYHAEIEAIHNACTALGGWRLWDCELYVTLEPCPMCAGAIVNAHIPRITFGAYDRKNGACGSITDVLHLKGGFQVDCTGGVMEEECRALLTAFFRKLRKT